MREFVDKTAAMEGKDGVLSVSIGHCFPYADVPELSGRIPVITDGDKAKADRLAMAFSGSPVVMADPAGNAGGGAPSDNTTILHRMIARDVQGAAVFRRGRECDVPIAVRRQDWAWLGRAG